MKKFVYVAVICSLAVSACTTPFKKVKDGGGLEYKVISGNGTKVAYGNYVELAVTQAYNDSILVSGSETPTNIAPIDSSKLPPMYFSIFKDLKKGDSVVLRQATDSLFKSAAGQLPPFIKKGHYIYTRLKVMNVFKTQEQADSCQNAQMALQQKRDSLFVKDQIVKDNKEIEEYLVKNKISTTVKGEKGTFVQVLNAGVGNTVDTSQVLMINYTGRLMSGKAFDSNTDTAFHHPEPLPVSLAHPEVIPGWIDGLKMLKKGAKAKLYIPSALGYGKRGSGERIPANSNLIFDIDVVDIITNAQYTAMMQARQKQQMEQQKMMQQMQQQMQQQNPQNQKSPQDQEQPKGH